MNCARIVRFAFEHKNTYISASTQRILTIFFLIFLVWLLLTVKTSFFVLSAVASELRSKKDQNWRHLSTKMTSLFLNFDWIKKIHYSHFVAETFLFLTIYIDRSFDLDLCIKSWKSCLNILSNHFMSRQMKIQSTKINLKANMNCFYTFDTLKGGKYFHKKKFLTTL